MARDGAVLDAARHDEDVLGAERDPPLAVGIAQVDVQLSAHDEEHLVRGRVAVPHELAQYPDRLDGVVVDAGQRTRAPELVDVREGLSNVADGFIHLSSCCGVGAVAGHRVLLFEVVAGSLRGRASVSGRPAAWIGGPAA